MNFANKKKKKKFYPIRRKNVWSVSSLVSAVEFTVQRWSYRVNEYVCVWRTNKSSWIRANFDWRHSTRRGTRHHWNCVFAMSSKRKVNREASSPELLPPPSPTLPISSPSTATTTAASTIAVVTMANPSSVDTSEAAVKLETPQVSPTIQSQHTQPSDTFSNNNDNDEKINSLNFFKVFAVLPLNSHSTIISWNWPKRVKKIFCWIDLTKQTSPSPFRS